MATVEHSFGGRAVRAVWSALLVLLFASWWGGLTFYAVVVVPIGSQQVGSDGQGFITQQVTWWHNALLAAMIVCLAIEAWRVASRWLAGIVVGLILTGAALIFEHSRLTSMLDFETRSISDGFYGRHAFYLWLTAAEWALGIAAAFALVLTKQSRALQEE